MRLQLGLQLRRDRGHRQTERLGGQMALPESILLMMTGWMNVDLTYLRTRWRPIISLRISMESGNGIPACRSRCRRRGRKKF
ncbi:hypothetical protein VE23_06330 [Paenibacillus sp. D9]|nr:hypothetical protein VE23_06330 [Paenibacillus sp. D9]